MSRSFSSGRSRSRSRPAAVTARRGSSASRRHSRLPNTPLPPRTRTLNGVTVSRLLYPGALERNVVVEFGTLAARRGTTAAATRRRRSEVLVHAAAAHRRAAAVAAAVEHGERAAEARDHDLGRIALLAALVGPFAGRQLALDIDLRALAHVLLRDLSQLLVEDHDAVPFGALLALAALAIAPGVRRGDRHVHHGSAVLHGRHFGVAAEIADQDDLVHAARHRGLLRFPGAGGTPAPTSRGATYSRSPVGSHQIWVV